MEQPAPRRFSLNAAITGIEYLREGSPPERGGAPIIHTYNGSQLHYHVNHSSPGRVDIVIDQYGPNSISGSGVINTITLVYTYQNPPAKEDTQTMVFSPSPSATFEADKKIQPSLLFSDDTMTSAVLVLRESVPLLEATYIPHPHVGIWVIAKEYTEHGEGPEGYFIDVPLNLQKYSEVTQATIVWPPKASMAGPVGGATSP